MTSFVEVSADVPIPARYADACRGLLARVVDATEREPPDGLVTTPIGERIQLAITWGLVAVTAELGYTWGVSVDEMVATALDNVEALDVDTGIKRVGDAEVEITAGHAWVSTLMARAGTKTAGGDGLLVAVPRFDTLLTTPVGGIETIDGLEALMAACDGMYQPDPRGVSPFVWWWYNKKYYRLTDRMPDGSVDIQVDASAVGYHFLGALEHAMHPCPECDRPDG